MELQNISDFLNRYTFPLINAGITVVIYLLLRIKIKQLSCLAVFTAFYSSFLATSFLSIYQNYIGKPDALILIAGGMLFIESSLLSVFLSLVDFTVGKSSGVDRTFGGEADFERVLQPLVFRKAGKRLGAMETAVVASFFASIALFLYGFLIYPGWVLTLIGTVAVMLTSTIYYLKLI